MGGWQRGKEAFGEQGKCFEFVATDRKRENGDIDFAGPGKVEQERRDFFYDREAHLGKFS